jgi:hypothetical protein
MKLLGSLRVSINKIKRTTGENSLESFGEKGHLRADCSRLLQQQLRKHCHQRWTVGIAGLQGTTTMMIEAILEVRQMSRDR